MKNTFKFFAAALAIVAAASCSKELSDNNSSDGRDEHQSELIDVTFNASLETPVDPTATKTTLASDGLTVHWSEEDKILPFPNEGSNSPYEGRNYQLSLTNINGNVAQFTGSVPSASTYGAIYPKSAVYYNDCYADVYRFNNIASQTVRSKNFSVGQYGICNYAMALGHGKDDVFQFKNCLAQIKFKVSIPGVKYVEVKASKVSTYISRSAGDEFSSEANLGCDIWYRPGSATYSLRKGSTIITATNNNEEFVVGETYYIAIPAVTMDGFTMECKDANGNVIYGKTKQSQFVAASNTIYNIGTLGGTTVGEDVQINPVAVANHVTDINGNIIGTDVIFYVQPTDASKITDFNLTASLDGYRMLSTSNPSAETVMTVINDNKYLPKGNTGYYLIDCNYSVNGNKHTKTVRVNIPDPEFSSKTDFTNSFTYYADGFIEQANKMNPGDVILNRSTVSINYDIVSKFPVNFEVELNGNKFSVQNSNYVSTTWSKTINSLPAGKHQLKTRVTFDGVTRESVQDVYVTGLPMKSINSSDWTGNNVTFTDGKAKMTNNSSLNLNLDAPVDINVSMSLDTYVYGHHAEKYGFEYTFILGETSFSKSIIGDVDRDQYFSVNETPSVWKSGTKIKMATIVDQVDNSDPAYVDVNAISILYR